MDTLPNKILPIHDKSNDTVNLLKSDKDRQHYGVELYSRWKHFQYDKWPISMTIKPFDLDYYPNSPIFAVYLLDSTKEHWVRFYLLTRKDLLILDMFGDLRKFPADWFPTAEVTPEDVQSWLKRRFDHD